MKRIDTLNIIIKVIVIVTSIVLSIITIINKDFFRFIIDFFVIGIIIIPDILNKFLKIKIDKYTNIIYTLFIFFSYFLGSVCKLYYYLAFYDKLIHFVSGIVSCIFGIYILVLFKKYEKKDMFFNIIFCVFFTFAVAGFWEIFEYTSDLIFKNDVQKYITTGLNDTMQDIIYAFGASLVFTLFWILEEKNKIKIGINRYVNEISKIVYENGGIYENK